MGRHLRPRTGEGGVTDPIEGTFRWVPNNEVEKWKAEGWEPVDTLESHHDQYSTLMRQLGPEWEKGG